ncbi:MAG: FAD-dependent oxidoreductase [Nitrospiria bacterium]
MNRKKDTRRKLLVVGNGMAAMTTVEAILKKKPELAITIFGDEQQPNYNRILLSNVLAGKTDAEKIILHPKAWYAEHGIDLRQGISVTSIDAETKTVRDASGEATPYDRLLLATGGIPVVPPIEGSEKEGVFVFRTLADTEKIVAAASREMEAVVIGGGLLGLEAARGLINYGLSVTVVHLADRLMEQQLDGTGAALLKQEIERMGIRVLLGTTAEKISGETSVTEVRLSTGEILPAGMVVVCTGTRPNTSITHTAGVKVKRGIVVDDRMETSIPDIFAVGDVIEHRGRTYGLIAPLKEQAGVIADAIAGQDRKRYAGTLCATTLKVAGISLTSAGELGRRAGGEALAFLDTTNGIYKKCVIRQNRLTGFILLGDNRDGTRLFGLLKKGNDLAAIKDQLLGNVSVENGAGPPASGATALADSDTVCNCNDVSKETIVSAIRKKGLESRDEVAACTEATTGCGSCGEIVDDLLRMVNQPAPSAQAPSLGATSTLNKKKPSSTKTLDLEKIKQEGLGIDFSRIKKEGSRAVSMDDKYRLKTYGICVQKHAGYSIVRIRIPGGRVTFEQVRHLADLAAVHGRGQIHLTMRQNMELHWVRVEEAEDIFERLRRIGLTTRSTCGHTLRNVMACPHGAISKDGTLDVQPWAALISDYFIQRSDLINPTMPNRLNVYFSGCNRCNADAAINDIAFVAVQRRNGTKDALGFEVWVGGSLGAKPILGYKLRDFIPLSDALPVCQAVFEIHTRHGNRNKARSRLKFLIAEWGKEKFTEIFNKVFLEKKGNPENREAALPTGRNKEKTPWIGKQLSAALIPTDFSTLPSGVDPQKQRGLAALTIAIPLGEIRSETLSEIGKIARRFGNGTLYFTKEQDIALHGISMRSIGRTVKALKRLGLSLKERESGPTLLACPGIEFCTLAITHAQGAARELINHYKPTSQAKQDLFNAISIHISGCPNSCAKHQVADIGLAGTLLPVGDARRYSYHLFLGGTVSETVQLGDMVRKGITEEMVIPTVDALLDIVLAFRQEGEAFKAVVRRVGPKTIAKLLEKKIAPFVPEAAAALAMVTTELIEG